MQEENETNNPAENNTTDEQGIEGSMKKKKTTGQKKVRGKISLQCEVTSLSAFT